MSTNSTDTDPILLDCSRISNYRSGLGRFAILAQEALVHSQRPFQTVGTSEKAAFSIDHPIPRYLLKRYPLPFVAPLLWYYFARFKFPASPSTRTFSVMQNVIPSLHEQVVTLHDLRPMFKPDNYVQGFYWRRILPSSLRQTKAILTVSNTSKQKICLAAKIPSSKVFVVSNAFEHKGGQSENVTKSSRLLCVGCNWAHKNIHEFLDQFGIWGHQYTLDIVSANTPYIQSLKTKVSVMGIGEFVQFHHNVPDEQLMQMYQSAAALIYPSMDEGFGIPPLEAMSFNTPVIASNIPVFRELFAESPIYVELGNPKSWSIAFEQLANPEMRMAHIRSGSITASLYPKNRAISEINTALESIWPMAK